MSNSDNNSVNIKSGNDSTTIEKRFTGGDGQGNLSLILPDKNFKYNPDNTAYSDKDIYLVASKNEPSSSLTDSNYDTAFLSYSKDGSINWKSDIESISGYETTFKGVVNLLDENLLVGMGKGPNNSRTTTRGKILDYIKDNKYEWISLHSCVADIGLNQIAWNTNENYNIRPNNSSGKTLKVLHKNVDDDVKCKIYYIDNTNTLKYKEDTLLNLNLNDLENVKKVNSAELTKGINKGDIKFVFQEETSQDKGQVGKLTLLKKSNNDSCFDYNEDYYTNPQFNSFLNLDTTNDEPDSTTTSEETVITEDIELSNTNIDNKELCDLLSDNVTYELEGGSGRKVSVKISGKSGSTFNIKIENPGYLYLFNDELRFKTPGNLRDNYYFKVTEVGDKTDVNTNFLQEFIKAGSGKSNTIKRAFVDDELFIAKSLQISGSIQGNVLIRLIKLKNVFEESSNICQQTIKEVYYYKRNNINDTFDINTVYEENTELYIDIQKIIRTDDNVNEDDDRSTLNFSLNGVLYNSNPSN